MKTIGTLKEIGAQVGDVIEWDCRRYVVCFNSPYMKDGIHAVAMGDSGWISNYANNCRIISRAQKSPVRTVTRKEIVPGKYGRVSVERLDNGDWNFEVLGLRTASDLTAAIQTLTEIRDAMQETT